ncbi:alpha-galactosidase A precursor [Penicillium maclennaniae]|uniref:alpha-galactosidase A precursor n=1 Tax=Penicillium maclennaniae TaxID=1343394 RepID=UPI002541774D|nr:alpha-galactosidase A precursor [Penicillium maclennaniae]KAJ5684535.1 alpha-galactosidase A precursor [Penicillium maclennaniae]
MCFGPFLVSVLPTFPTGDWNDGLVAKDANDGKPFFARVCLAPFPAFGTPGMEPMSTTLIFRSGANYEQVIYEAKSSLFDDIVVAKFARFPWEVQYIENETTAYQWISGRKIGPQILGHLTEHGRVIGLLMERITGARHAGAEDIEVCREALSRLHNLGVRHGDTNRFNFLIRESKATLIDFDMAQKCGDCRNQVEGYFLEAEKFIRMKGLKRKKSRKVRLLHHCYVLERIFHESIFICGADSTQRRLVRRTIKSQRPCTGEYRQSVFSSV